MNCMMAAQTLPEASVPVIVIALTMSFLAYGHELQEINVSEIVGNGTPIVYR